MKSRKKMFFAFTAAALCLALLMAFAGCAPEDKNALRIGMVGPLTGTTAEYGIKALRGIEIAVEEANSSGELGELTLEIISEDTEGDWTKAANAFKKLINVDKVDVIVGAVLSSETEAGGPIVKDSKIPTISPTSTSENLTKDNPYLFRNCLTDKVQAELLVEYAVEELGLGKYAILYTNNDYGESLKDSFEAKAKALAEVVAIETFMDKDEDFKSQLDKIKQSNPDCLFIGGYYTEAAKIAFQAIERGLDIQILGADGLNNEALIEIGGEAVEGTYATSGFYAGEPSPDVQNFVTTYKEKYNETPDMFAAQAYDAARIVIEAIKDKGITLKQVNDGTATELIREGIASTKDFPGISGKTTLDKEGEAIKNAFILKVEGGKFVLAKSPVED